MAASQTDPVVDKDDSIHEECEELIACESAHAVSAGYLPAKGRSIAEWIASRPWGQMVFKSVDRVLWCIERTMLWQNPSPDAFVPMVRPVNALIAYPLAALLWVLQHLLFVTAESSSANELIRWVQVRRRRLRAVRFLGIRNMRSNNILGRPETSNRFAQLAWFFGMLPAGISKELEIDDKAEEKDVSITAEDDSEHNKKRRHSAVSETTDEGAVVLDDDDYNSENDSDYVPECLHSSESSDSDLSSVEDAEETEETEETEELELNESVRTNQS